jgi:hypothetical protein
MPPDRSHRLSHKHGRPHRRPKEDHKLDSLIGDSRDDDDDDESEGLSDGSGRHAHLTREQKRQLAVESKVEIDMEDEIAYHHHTDIVVARDYIHQSPYNLNATQDKYVSVLSSYVNVALGICSRIQTA